MRSTKLLTALIAAFTTACLALTAVPAEAAKPPHRLKQFSAGVTAKDNRLYFAKGRAVTAKGQRVYLQYSPWGSKRYRTYKSTTAKKSNGRFSFRFRSACGAKWRIYIKADKQQRGTNRFDYVRNDRPDLRKYFGRVYC